MGERPTLSVAKEEVSVFVFHANLSYGVYGIPTLYREMTFLDVAQEENVA